MKPVFRLGVGAKRIARNFSWLFAEKLLRMVLGLAVGIWVARYLGPEQFGILNYALAYVGLFAILPTAGISSIVVRDLVTTPRRTDEILGSAALVQLSLGFVAYFLLVTLILFVQPTDTLTQKAVLVLGLSLLFKFADVSAYWFESKVSSKFTAISFLIALLVSAALRVAFIKLEMDLIWFVWTLFIETIVASALLLLFLARERSFFSFKVSLVEIKRILKQGFPLLLASAAATVYLRIDQIMLGNILGNDSVGIYSAAVRITEAFLFLPIIITSSVFPFTLEAKKEGRAVFNRAFQHLFSILALLALAIAVPMTFLSAEIILLLFGKSFLAAAPILAIHIWANVFSFIGVAAYRWYVSENMQVLLMYRTGVGAFINIVLNLILIPTQGAIGAAVATVVSLVFSVLLADWFQKSTRELFWMKLSSLNIIRSIRDLSSSRYPISR